MRYACVIWLATTWLMGCEGRTAMRVSVCSTEGATKSCEDPCGAGLATCRGGLWSACDVAPRRLPCTNTCGEGTQVCENGARRGACEVASVVVDCSTVCGTGVEICADGKWQPCTAKQPKRRDPKLTAVIRDFHTSFPDMNRDGISEKGMVETILGSDDKPVYAHAGATETVQGRATFDQWYRDVPGVNTSMTLEIPLRPSPSSPNLHTYSNTAFFPIDDKLFGNESQPHNYAFTAEIVTRFYYGGGEVFTFEGDDDVFVFINRRLVIDLGGIHSSLSQTVDLDESAAMLGLTKAQYYPMHIFFAERHMTESNFVVSTTITDFALCDD